MLGLNADFSSQTLRFAHPSKSWSESIACSAISSRYSGRSRRAVQQISGRKSTRPGLYLAQQGGAAVVGLDRKPIDLAPAAPFVRRMPVMVFRAIRRTSYPLWRDLEK